mmetsp:Transcript_12158/g.51173  ORF Transcript_12158/g.51173 Transcript_12158/m.51173 type:complete len:363 (-) Transcript_12158:85-1173(-)
MPNWRCLSQRAGRRQVHERGAAIVSARTSVSDVVQGLPAQRTRHNSQLLEAGVLTRQHHLVVLQPVQEVGVRQRELVPRNLGLLDHVVARHGEHARDGHRHGQERRVGAHLVRDALVQAAPAEHVRSRDLVGLANGLHIVGGALHGDGHIDHVRRLDAAHVAALDKRHEGQVVDVGHHLREQPIAAAEQGTGAHDGGVGVRRLHGLLAGEFGAHQRALRVGGRAKRRAVHQPPHGARLGARLSDGLGGVHVDVLEAEVVCLPVAPEQVEHQRAALHKLGDVVLVTDGVRHERDLPDVAHQAQVPPAILVAARGDGDARARLAERVDEVAADGAGRAEHGRGVARHGRAPTGAAAEHGRRLQV